MSNMLTMRDVLQVVHITCKDREIYFAVSGSCSDIYSLPAPMLSRKDVGTFRHLKCGANAVQTSECKLQGSTRFIGRIKGEHDVRGCRGSMRTSEPMHAFGCCSAWILGIRRESIGF